jgi:lysophospholipase L1-like esterase
MNMNIHLRPSILLFGDSLTQFGFGVNGQIGWASLLSAAYTRRADVRNRGYSGYNTEHALQVLPRIFVANENVLFYTVFLGANDAAVPGESQHVPLNTFGENLQTIITNIRSFTKEDIPIIVMTPPPVDEEAWAKYRGSKTSCRTNEASKQYGQKAIQVATALNCKVLDTWTLLGGSGNDRTQHLSDGLHLSESGNRLVYQGLMELIETQLPDLAPMSDEDGQGKYGTQGVPMQEELWKKLCGLPLDA